MEDKKITGNPKVKKFTLNVQENAPPRKRLEGLIPDLQQTRLYKYSSTTVQDTWNAKFC